MGPEKWRGKKNPIANPLDPGVQKAWKVEGANKYMRKSLKEENRVLKTIINDIIWMAARYAHGRNTYAPSIFRDSVRKLKLMDPGFSLKRDITINAPEHELKGFDFREDYLDDLYEKEDTISVCKKCICVTKTINGKCGKCKYKKEK